jgi:hypothetical protein
MLHQVFKPIPEPSYGTIGYRVGSLLLPFSRTARLATEILKRELPKLSARMDS